MNDETRRKIEENVIEVLKQSNIEDTTEFKVRSQVEERLGIDLSNKQCKLLVRNVVESFLLSMSERVCMGKEDEPGPSVRYENRAVEQKIIPKKEFNDDGDLLICRLSNNRSVTIHKFKRERMVSIRQYYAKDGKQLPTLKGISMPTEQWSVFKSNIPAIAEAILQMKRNKRSEHDADKIGAISNPTRVTYPKFPIETIRFDGKNYHAWAHQMELLLQDLKIAYVLSNQCPTAVLGAESSSGNAAQSKVAEQKWMSDDHMCHRNILNSLSDRLFNEYSKKPMSASELWKELKLLYFLEEFGTKRSQVKKYLEFKMVEEKSILEQVEELNHIADSIGSAGTIIDEDFHVSAIISKLPLSWKNVWMSLMHEHYLPLSKLTDRLRIEEQLRTQKNSRLSRVSIGPNTRGQHHAANHPSKMGDPMPVTVPLRKKECQKEVKTLLCLDCGKEGHTSPNCPTKKVDN